MVLDFYMMRPSTPCRSVKLVIEALGIADKVQDHTVNLFENEHLKPEFIKLNPQHTIPTLVDDGFSLWESRAILRYLVNKYGGADNSLYPADAQARAVIDQRLDFDIGTLYTKFAGHFYPKFFGGEHPEGSLQQLQEALGLFNTFLEGQKYAAGDKLTIADLSLVSTISTIEATGISLSEYPNIVRWFDLVKTTAPNYVKANEEPLAQFVEMIKNKTFSE